MENQDKNNQVRQEQDEHEKIILEILELQREKLEELEDYELKMVIEEFKNKNKNKNKMEKTLIEEIRLGEHDFYDEIEEVLNDEGVELRDFELCNRETQHRIENKIKLVLEKVKKEEEEEEIEEMKK